MEIGIAKLVFGLKPRDVGQLLKCRLTDIEERKYFD